MLHFTFAFVHCRVVCESSSGERTNDIQRTILCVRNPTAHNYTILQECSDAMFTSGDNTIIRDFRFAKLPLYFLACRSILITSYMDSLTVRPK
jgi:hypothetical protein